MRYLRQVEPTSYFGLQHNSKRSAFTSKNLIHIHINYLLTTAKMGGWKSEKSVEEQRKETIAALEKRFSEQKTNYKVWKECLTEIIADTPEVS